MSIPLCRQPQLVSHARLCELFDYDPLSGLFTRKVAAGARKQFSAGSIAGNIDPCSGYVRVGIDGRDYWAHRLAWFYVHAEWAPDDVDHKDRVRHHNWISNLRAVTRAHNLQNQVAPNTASKSGIRGVHWDAARRKWRAELSVGNRNKLVGRFDSKEDAKAAYLKAKSQLHPGFIQP